MSGDPEQDYFADGMVEEITTDLSRMRGLFVIARNSSFTYKGRAVDVKQVGRELGVRYVVEGSVRRAGNRVRIAGQLIDAVTGSHLWADRFDGALEDVFDLQDRVAQNIVAAIAPKIEQVEIARARRKPTESQDAYDLYLRGLAAVHLWTREGNAEALALFQRAVALDPDFAAAYGLAARCYAQRKASGWVTDRGAEVAEAERLARRAAVLDATTPWPWAGPASRWPTSSAMSTPATSASSGRCSSTPTSPGAGCSAPGPRCGRATMRAGLTVLPGRCG